MAASTKLIFLFFGLNLIYLSRGDLAPERCYSYNEGYNLAHDGNPDGKLYAFESVIIGHDGKKHNYYYNPCYEFTLNDKCKNAAACELDDGSAIADADLLAIQENSFFDKPDEGEGKVVKYYKDLEKKNVVFIVHLLCAEEGTGANFEIIINSTTAEPPSAIEANFKSECFCLEKKKCLPPTKPGEGGGGLSTGSIIVIVFFVFVLVYLLLGVLWKTIMVGAQGTEAIPNVRFWSDFPSLVMDGCRFAFCCNRTRTTYDST